MRGRVYSLYNDDKGQAKYMHFWLRSKKNLVSDTDSSWKYNRVEKQNNNKVIRRSGEWKWNHNEKILIHTTWR